MRDAESLRNSCLGTGIRARRTEAGGFNGRTVGNGDAKLSWEATFTMLTLNADDHDLMKYMHRPDPKRPPEMQDKRMVVILPKGLYEAWLDAPASESTEFMRQYPADRLVATPEPAPPKIGETPRSFDGLR